MAAAAGEGAANAGRVTAADGVATIPWLVLQMALDVVGWMMMWMALRLVPPMDLQVAHWMSHRQNPT